ncbi:MAG: OmpA family protein [Elusimicrobia bacterium]|nr:OmpA family protein [Elusimicrobiota bacterium]
MKKNILLPVLVVFGLALFSGCATTKEPKVVILEKLIILEDMHFQYNTDILTKAGKKAILRNLKVLNDNPGIKIRIAGYTASSGTEEENQKLSERRANTVREILIAGNIAPERLKAIGYGEARPAMYEPVPKNIDSTEAAANRRVLFEIIVK